MKFYAVLTLTLLTVTSFGGTITARASEVTGTLSSNPSALPGDATGSLSGTVTGSVGGEGSRSSGGSTSGGGLTTAQPAGQVLGAATSNIPSPAFPNAGESADLSDVPTLFVLMLGTLALAVLMFVRRKVQIV